MLMLNVNVNVISTATNRISPSFHHRARDVSAQAFRRQCSGAKPTVQTAVLSVFVRPRGFCQLFVSCDD